MTSRKRGSATRCSSVASPPGSRQTFGPACGPDATLRLARQHRAGWSRGSQTHPQSTAEACERARSRGETESAARAPARCTRVSHIPPCNQNVRRLPFMTARFPRPDGRPAPREWHVGPGLSGRGCGLRGSSGHTSSSATARELFAPRDFNEGADNRTARFAATLTSLDLSGRESPEQPRSRKRTTPAMADPERVDRSEPAGNRCSGPDQEILIEPAERATLSGGPWPLSRVT